MKKLKITFVVALTILFNACSSDDNSTPPLTNFKINDVTYELFTQDPNSFAIVTFNSIPSNFGGETYINSSISIIGKTSDNTKIGTVAFRLVYKSSQGIAGTYVVSNNEDDLEDVVIANQRAIIGWVSIAQGSAISGTPVIDGNDPVGTVEVVSNGNNNYTLKFNGEFRKYNSNFQIQSTFPVQINLTATATITTM